MNLACTVDLQPVSGTAREKRQIKKLCVQISKKITEKYNMQIVIPTDDLVESIMLRPKDAMFFVNKFIGCIL